MNRITLKFKVQKRLKSIASLANDFHTKKKGKRGVELQELAHTYSAESALLYDEILELQTTYWKNVALKKTIPLPDEEFCWQKSRITGLKNLSPKGINQMRKLIREANMIHFAWGTMIAGILSAATGLLATWKTLQ